MGPISITIDAAIHDVKAPATTPETGPGIQHALGTRVDFSQSSSIDTIAYIATATPPAGYAAGDVFSGPGYHDQTNLNALVAAGAIEKFSKPANSGGMTWLYVEAGEAIARGEAVMLDHTEAGKYVMLKSNEAGKTKGVAQWNIPSGSFAWVQAVGVGKILVDTAGVTAGDRIEAGPTAGRAEDIAVATDLGYGRALATAASGALADADITCLG